MNVFVAAFVYLAGIGMPLPVAAPDDNLFPGTFGWAGDYTNATALDLDLKSTANRIGYHPFTDSDPDFTFVGTSGVLLWDLPTAELLFKSKLPGSTALRFGPTSTNVRTIPIGPLNGTGVHAVATGSDATVRASKPRGMEDLAPIDLPFAAPLKGQTFKLTSDGVATTGTIPYTLLLRGAYIRGAYTVPGACGENGEPMTPLGKVGVILTSGRP